MELPVVGRYANSPNNFFVVAVPRVPSGFSLSHEVRNRYFVPITIPRCFNPTRISLGEVIPVIAIRAAGISPSDAAEPFDINRSPKSTKSSATIAPMVNECIRNLRSRRINTSPFCAPRTSAAVSPITTCPRDRTSAIASPPIARMYATGATMVAIGMRHLSPRRSTSLPVLV